MAPSPHRHGHVSYLRRSLDCLLGASFVYGCILMSTNLSGGSYMGTKVLARHDDDDVNGKLAAAKLEVERLKNAHEGTVATLKAVMEKLDGIRGSMASIQNHNAMHDPSRDGSDAATDDVAAVPWPYESKQDGSRSPCPGRHDALEIDDVAIGVLTSGRFLETRLGSQQRTWLRQVRHVVFYSESEVAHLPTVALSPPVGEQLVGGGAWKNFPALMDLHRRFPSHKWIYFCDDDTYVFVDNLLTALSKFNPAQDHYVGLYCTRSPASLAPAFGRPGGEASLSPHPHKHPLASSCLCVCLCL